MCIFAVYFSESQQTLYDLSVEKYVCLIRVNWLVLVGGEAGDIKYFLNSRHKA